MERRAIFTNADLHYLANLCHNCRGCYYACQYAPPHEFGLNLPKSLAQVRNESYAYYAWPRPLSKAFERNGVLLSIISACSLTVIMACTMYWRSPDVLYGHHVGPGAFYRIFPFRTMTGIALITFGYSLLAMGIGCLRFWREMRADSQQIASPGAVLQASSDVLTLRNLGGGAAGGCNDKNESFSTHRRLYHHLLFYGFMLCTASTMVAAVYDHFLHRIAPYAFLSLPVLLGTAGGILMLVGCSGLMALKIFGDQTPSEQSLLGADMALILLLGMSALSGLLLLAFRSTAGMGILLAFHLALIFALFLVLPYSKFVHGVYRSAALLKNAMEKERPVSIEEF